MRQQLSENRQASDSNSLPLLIAFLATFTGTGIGCALFMVLHEIQTTERLIETAREIHLDQIDAGQPDGTTRQMVKTVFTPDR